MNSSVLGNPTSRSICVSIISSGARGREFPLMTERPHQPPKHPFENKNTLLVYFIPAPTNGDNIDSNYKVLSRLQKRAGDEKGKGYGQTVEAECKDL